MFIPESRVFKGGNFMRKYDIYVFAGCGENLKLISLTSLVICKDFKYKKLRKIFKERKLFKGGNYMRKYGIYLIRLSIECSVIVSAIQGQLYVPIFE